MLMGLHAAAADCCEEDSMAGACMREPSAEVGLSLRIYKCKYNSIYIYGCEQGLGKCIYSRFLNRIPNM